MQRIQKYTKYTPECLIIAVIYIDKYNLTVPDFNLSWYNIHRLLLTCIMLAVKFHNDVYFDNRSFEKGGGVGVQQLFTFELEIF